MTTEEDWTWLRIRDRTCINKVLLDRANQVAVLWSTWEATYRILCAMPSSGSPSTHHSHIGVLLQASVTFALKNELSALMGGCQEILEDGHTLELTSATNGYWKINILNSSFLVRKNSEKHEKYLRPSPRGAQWSWVSDPCRNNLFFTAYTTLTCFHSLPCSLTPYWCFLGPSYRKLSYTQILIFCHPEKPFQIPRKLGLS